MYLGYAGPFTYANPILEFNIPGRDGHISHVTDDKTDSERFCD